MTLLLRSRFIRIHREVNACIVSRSVLLACQTLSRSPHGLANASDFALVLFDPHELQLMRTLMEGLPLARRVPIERLLCLLLITSRALGDTTVITRCFFLRKRLLLLLLLEAGCAVESSQGF